MPNDLFCLRIACFSFLLFLLRQKDIFIFSCLITQYENNSALFYFLFGMSLTKIKSPFIYSELEACSEPNRKEQLQ